MSKQEEQQLSPAEAAPKKGLVQSAQAFMNGVLSPLKGRDVGQMVEEFTSEMTLVAEGLSEDQARLQERVERLKAEHTQLEAHLQDQLHDAQVDAQELREQLAALSKRLDKAEKAAADKKLKKAEGLSAVLRQATWLVGILAGAWVLVTVLRFFQ